MITTKRGCGTRKTDSLYLESELSLDGLPIEHFLIIPPIPTEDLNIHWSRNFQLFEKDGITHLIDWVGEQYYESPWDFIEECKVKGASRRAPKNFPFEKLTIGKSMIFFAHKKAIYDEKFCLPQLFEWNIEGYKINLDAKPISWHRQVGDIKYKITENDKKTSYHSRDYEECKFKPGLFMRLPITNITYVRPKDQNKLNELQSKNVLVEIKNE